MIKVDIKALLSKLNGYCTNGLEAAAGSCVSRTHYEVTVEHLLLKLLDDPKADIPLILKQFDLEPGRLSASLESTLEQFPTGNAGKPVFSPHLLEWFQESWLTGSVDLGMNRIRSGILLLAMVTKPSQFTTSGFVDLLSPIGKDALLEQFTTIAQGSSEQPTAEEVAAREPSQPMAEGSALQRFCQDFTARAREGAVDPVFGRDQEIRQMVDILARRRKNNPIVVGEAGVGKTAVVEGLALRIALGDVPDSLTDVTILGLDMGLLQAGAGMRGEFENRLKSVINEIKASPTPIILFIDEAHTLIGAGGPSGGGDAANLLKPALARGELKTVAATTWSEYKKYFEKDAALARRFQLVKLDEPSVETSILILRGLKQTYEENHGVIVRDDAVIAAAELSSRYISGRQLPDKAVDLLDTSAARVKINLTAKPDVIEDRERRTQALERERKALERDLLTGSESAEHTERIQELNQELEEVSAELDALSRQWTSEKDKAAQLVDLRQTLYAPHNGSEDPAEIRAGIDALSAELAAVQADSPLIRTEVDADLVAKVVSDWTGVPLGNVLRDEARNVATLDDNLKARIKGQDGAISCISEGIKAAKTGLKDPQQPLGVFLLVGPSGTGKTETGLALADLLFGGERFMVTINMSEFQERHTVSRLIGSPPGYVGYGEGGALTEAVRQRPYSVVLLDEVEKAHLEVMNLFYQVFDKGALSDGEGRNIDFKNTVLFLTSNLASDVITQLCEADEAPDVETMTSAIRPILSNHFKPALLARMTIVPYLTLGTEVIKDIVALKLGKVAKRLKDTHKMTLTYSDEVMAQIAERCTEVETGARNIDFILHGTILPQISREILAGMGESGMPSQVTLGLAEDGTFDVRFQA